MKSATLTVRVVLVPHGYQIDIEHDGRATKDGQGIATAAVCRDFAGDYDPASAADVLMGRLILVMRELEKDINKVRPEASL